MTDEAPEAGDPVADGRREPLGDVADEEKQRRERVSWADSTERRKALAWEMAAALGGLFLIFYGAIRGELLPTVSKSSPLHYLNSLLGQIVAALLVYEVGRRYRKTQRKIHSDRFWLADARDDLDRAEAAVDDADGLRLPVLWDVTEKRLAYYHRIVTRQAEQSFRNGQIAMGTGFAVLILGASLALTADTTAKTVVSGALTAIGTAIAAYIGRTFVRSQESASQHLLMYFRQPLELSRFLTAERLLSDMSPTTRSGAARRLMESILSSGPENPSAQPPPSESARADGGEPEQERGDAFWPHQGTR